MQPMFAKQRAHRAESQCKSDFGRNTISFKVPYFVNIVYLCACVCVCVYVRKQIKTIESMTEFSRSHGINKIMMTYIYVYTFEKIKK